MFPSAPDLKGRSSVAIIPLPDPAVDEIGFDPRSHYVETFWLPILGPSTMWLMRKIAERFDADPNGFDLDLIDASRALGIASHGGRNNAFTRAVDRLVSFNMGATMSDDTIAVRRVMPFLHAGQVRRLSPRLQNLHDEAVRSRKSDRLEDLSRSTEVAIALLRLGDSPDLVEQQLISWGVEPQTAHLAVNHAWAEKARADQQARDDEMARSS